MQVLNNQVIILQWPSANNHSTHTYSCCQIHLSTMLKEELNKIFPSITANIPEWVLALLHCNNITRR